MNKAMFSVSFVAVNLLTGCVGGSWGIGESELACPGGAGVPCTSAYEINNMVSGYTPHQGRKLDSRGLDSRGKPYKESRWGKARKQEVASFAPGLSVPQQPIPVRAAPEVGRVYVAPYVDGNGNLVGGGYVYKEISPAKWNIGGYKVDGQVKGVPARVLPPSSAPAVQPSVSNPQSANEGATVPRQSEI